MRPCVCCFAIDPCLSVRGVCCLCLRGCDCERTRKERCPACHHLYRLDSFPSLLLAFLSGFSTSNPSLLLLPWSPGGGKPFSAARFNLAPAPPCRCVLGAQICCSSFLGQRRLLWVGWVGGSEVFLIQFRFCCAVLCWRAGRCSGAKPPHSWAAAASICAGAGARFDWRGVFLETGAPIRRRRVPATRSGSPTLMRLSHCESNCADPLCYIPCLPKSKDAPAAGALSSAAPCPVAAEDKPPPVQKIDKLEAEKDDDGGEGGKDGDGEKTLAPAAPPPKSNLKKPNCADGDACAPKGNVKWLDLLGKDLTEVKEFEPSESGDSMDDGDGMSGCVCVIQ